MEDLVLGLPTAASWFQLALWFCAAVVIVIGTRVVRFLRDVPTVGDGVPPKLAVLVPALNEARGIRAALESLLAQDYPGLLVVPVNDRSTDETGEIMDRLAVPGRLAPIHVRELPADWLGKNHANHVAATEAMRQGAEWLLFTDGDVQFAPRALRHAVDYARARGLEHLAVAPELVYHSFGEAALLACFLIAFCLRFRPWFVERPWSRGYVGIGAFNLIRADAYRKIGGHQALRLTAADDVALGKLARDAGCRRGFLDGRGEVKVQWQPSLRETIRGLYKNTFASLDFSVLKTLAAVAATLMIQVFGYLLPFVVTGPARWAAVGALALQMGIHAMVSHGLGRAWPYALAVGVCAGFGGLVLCWIMIVSAILCLRQGGIVWRGTHYPWRRLLEAQVRV